MKNIQQFDVAIIGGASAGLAAALILGRSIRKTVVFDTGEPRNRPAAHAHNVFTRDGVSPLEILAIGREQLKAYPSVTIAQERVITAAKEDGAFRLETASGGTFVVRKVIIATGVKDILPEIAGIQALWGNKVIHCPYCHGWEAKNTPIALIGNDDMAYHLIPIVRNLNKDLTVFTNGKSAFSEEQQAKLQQQGIGLIETPVTAVEDAGDGMRLVLADGTVHHKQAAYVRAVRMQFNNELAVQLGCELEEAGSIKVDEFQQTTVPGVFAAGDVAHPMFHQVMAAAAGGLKAGGMCNGQLSMEDFEK
ncbi:NAD(P)/FAD-dependent oxidoreductase [Chitinophaga filiformis]|uniref:NAD(P)/FAD-dependent oxidoreductase n=1 Tax=Chitinophaga filiformis TaxID=104663 RepID=UPI001F22EA1B|nr:NAD(P)/FAD-dependent oxidoreductase [Chitinophaga filiformis]MCF6407080.1 NAD(P)/FAD-dependent oxidoreductase [Chitinophaga filiformis]